MKIRDIILNGVKVKEIIYEDSDYTSQDQRNAWLSICNECESHNDGICDNCGCSLLTKMQYSNSHCSINKW